MNRQEVFNLVHRTRSLILNRKKSQEITVKGAADYVTAVDFAVQNFLKEKLAEETPGVPLLAEEQKNGTPDPEKSYWILDPIDGTTNLIHDYRMSAVSLAFHEKGAVTFGIVYNPFTEETFYAESGRGAELNGMPIHVSGRKEAADCVISLGASPYEKNLAPELFPVFQRVFAGTADFRRSGSAAMDLCHVAAGRIDGYFEWNLKPWDYAAGQLIAREAGGIATTWSGKDLPILRNSDVLACTPGIFEAMKRWLLNPMMEQ